MMLRRREFLRARIFSHVSHVITEVAGSAQVDVDVLQASLERSVKALFAVREQRVKPGKDEKILTSWNGLILRSFAETFAGLT